MRRRRWWWSPAPPLLPLRLWLACCSKIASHLSRRFAASTTSRSTRARVIGCTPPASCSSISFICAAVHGPLRLPLRITSSATVQKDSRNRGTSLAPPAMK